MPSFFGTLTIAAATPASIDVGRGGLSGVLIGNESGLTVIVTMQGANVSRSLYPGTIEWFPIANGSPFNGNILFNPQANLSNTSSWPSSYLQIDTYGPSEKPQGTYPVSLPRSNNVGNTVTTTGGSTPTTMNFDGGKITSDGSGNITEQGTLTANALSISGLITSTLANPGLALSLLGKISVDNGAITTDGSGNITTTGNITVAGNSSTNNSTYFMKAYKLGALILTFVRSTGGFTNIPVPIPCTTFFLAIHVGTTVSFLHSGSALSMTAVTTLNSTTGITNTTTPSNTFMETSSGFENLTMVGNGMVFIVGY
jgi:hypothetical protein